MSPIEFKNSHRKSYLGVMCASCILEVASKYLSLTYQNSPSNSSGNYPKTEEQARAAKKLVEQLAIEFTPEISPNEIATHLFLAAARLGNSLDPWKSIRDTSNKIALELLEVARADLASIQDQKTRLYRAIQWSITGNSIDFGTAGHESPLSKEGLLGIHKTVKDRGFQIDHFNLLWDELHRVKTCLYICDNAGEIAFDMLVIEELHKIGVKLTAVVKGGPISNDAILDDARQVGLDKVCLVITTGSTDLGFVPEENSPDFVRILKNSPLVITKGQANWEAVYAYQSQLPETILFYCILKVKCRAHADLFRVPLGGNLIYRADYSNFRA